MNYSMTNLLGIFFRVIALIIMIFFVVPKQVEAFSLKDDFRMLKLMLLIVSFMVIGSTIGYLALWLNRLGVFGLSESLYDLIIISASLTTIVISITLSLIYHHRYLRKGK
jgi:hypothetical protein